MLVTTVFIVGLWYGPNLTDILLLVLNKECAVVPIDILAEKLAAVNTDAVDQFDLGTVCIRTVALIIHKFSALFTGIAGCGLFWCGIVSCGVL